MPKKEFDLKDIILERNKEEKISTIILNRARKKNTLTLRMLSEIVEVLQDLKKDKRTRVLIFKGAKLENPPEGKLPAFSAGADLTSGLKGVSLTSPHAMSSAFAEIHEYFNKIEQFPKITIAAIDGYAAGGGCELSLVCDLRIATKRSQFALPELKLGAIPAGGGTQRLARLIGLSRAKQMILASEYISADQAYQYGLANYVVETNEFEEKVHELALKLAQGPPIHQKLVKKAMNLGFQAPLTVGLSLERDALGIAVATKDAQEGLMAFMEKRKPEFKGK